MRKKEDFAITTLKQAKRLVKIVIGITILLLGVAMLVLPGPGMVTIVLGLAILGMEFVWARKLYKRFEDSANNIKNSVFNNSMNRIAKYLEDLSKKLNQSQKIIVGLIVAAILFVITMAIADEVGTSCGFRRGGGYGCSGGPFDMEDTWYIWVIFLLIIGYFEFKLFGNQNNNEIKKSNKKVQ